MAGKRYQRTGIFVASLMVLAGLAGCRPEDAAEQPPANVPPEANAPAPTAPQGEAREVTMGAHNFRYEPSEVTVQPSQQIRLTLNNQGDTEHNIEFELPAGKVEFETNLAPGASDTLEFTAPAEPGRYEFYCPVGNHRKQGMTGTLIVEGTGGEAGGTGSR